MELCGKHCSAACMLLWEIWPRQPSLHFGSYLVRDENQVHIRPAQQPRSLDSIFLIALGPPQCTLPAPIAGLVGQIKEGGATTICRQLKLGNSGVASSSPLWFPAVAKSSVVWRDDDSCTGGESNYLSCSTEPNGYTTGNSIHQIACYDSGVGE